jgi:hypothetical protein
MTRCDILDIRLSMLSKSLDCMSLDAESIGLQRRDGAYDTPRRCVDANLFGLP